MTALNEVADLSAEGEIAVLTLNSPPVNALSAPVRDGLAEGFKRAIADPAVKAIVLICAGRTFIAGADISEFGKAPKGASLYDVQAVMEGSPKPYQADTVRNGYSAGQAQEATASTAPDQRSLGQQATGDRSRNG